MMHGAAVLASAPLTVIWLDRCSHVAQGRGSSYAQLESVPWAGLGLPSQYLSGVMQ